MPQKLKFSVKKFKVDRAAGKLTDLALVMGNREAKGHGIYLDAKTLQGALASVQGRGGVLKGAICHETFSEWWDDADRLMEVPGFFSGISISGDTLVASSFEFYESFQQDEPKAYRRLMEMAEKSPTLFGLSIEASGYDVFVDDNDNEYSQKPQDVALKYEGMPVFRITDLDAAAFVSEPAATDGLFAATFSRLTSGRLSKSESALIGEAFAAWNKQHSKENFSTPGSAGHHQPTENKDIMDKLLKALKEKFGQDSARYNQAVLFAVNHSDPDSLTADAVAAELDKIDLTALRKENEDLRKKVESAKGDEDSTETELQKLQREKSDLEARLKKAADSGEKQELSTGAPRIVAGQFKFTGQTDKLIQLGVISVDQADKLRNKFAAGTTSVADLILPSVFVRGMPEAVVAQPALINSGIVARNAEFDQLASGAGRTVTVPFFQEPDFASLLQVESTEPTAQKIADGSQIAAMLRRVSPLKVSSLAGALTASDPFGYILGILARLRNRQDSTTTLNALRGFFTTAAAALSEDSFVEVVGNQTSAHLFDSDIFADAISRLGEAASMLEGRGAVIVHSKIHAAMIKQDDVEDVRDSQGNLIVRTYRGIPLYMSDALVRAGTTSGLVYDTIVAGPATIAMGSKAQSQEIGDTASILIKGDEGTNDRTVYDRRQCIIHPAGAKYTGSPAAANSGPTDAELATAAGWALGFADAKNCGFVRIRTNG